MIITITILGGLALFLFGMKIMSEALQNSAGEKLKDVLWKVTNNRFKGVLIGFGITGLIQSSSVTTVMLVSFVNAGLINLLQSTGIILGANIGTTVTGWIVAIIGFKINIASFALPSIAIGFFSRFIPGEKLKYWGEVLLGFGLLFLGMSIMNGSVKDLRGSETVMNFMSSYHADGIDTAIIVVFIGAAITMLIQSSSAVMAMTMTLAYNGLIDFQTACALILGENIGTTITANLAAIGSSLSARRTAIVHLIFNLFGVIWVLTIFKPFFIPLVDFIIPGNPFSSDLALKSKAITDHMAGFHTLFNLSNTILFLPFTKYLAKAAERIIPKRKSEDSQEFHLKYISTALLSAPSINLNQARLEIERMMNIVTEMFDLVINVFNNPKTKLGPVVEKIQTLENHTDLLEKEISTFLVRVSQNTISEEQSQEISIMLQRVNELESIADHCESILKLIRRKYDKNIDFTENAMEQIIEISGKVKEFLSLIQENISKSYHNIIAKSEVIENRIDELRKEMRKDHVQRLNEGVCDVTSGLLFIDMLTSFEKIGDHAYNIAEGISGLRIF
ncbi:MAG: Na/Pi cotransporter family protein [Spirochaetes bacterium]|nr:Na/Pi cotransporter family protein [Spirochaetota bacterium]